MDERIAEAVECRRQKSECRVRSEKAEVREAGLYLFILTSLL